MNYSSPSPVSYAPPGGGGGGVSLGHHGPSTPIIPSPQDPSGDLNFNLIKNVNPGGGMQVKHNALNAHLFITKKTTNFCFFSSFTIKT